jgi:hypothetical protein
MYIQNANPFRYYKLTFADWFKLFRLIAKLAYKIDWSVVSCGVQDRAKEYHLSLSMDVVKGD